jgi:hypothetical protein
MKTRLLNLAFSVALFGCTNAYTQLTPHCPYTHHEQDLICLIPDVTQTGNTATLGGFNSTIAQVLGQLPLAVPNSGFVLGFDKGGTPVTLNDTLGSVLTERGNTIGRHKLFLGFTFQRFVFSTIDGNNLTNLPVFSDNSSSGTFNYSVSSLHANINQYTAFAAFGLTDRIDVSATLPFQRVSVSGGRSIAYSWSDTNGAAAGSQNPTYAPGAASGFGDLILNMKGSLLPGEGRARLALGMEARFPTGNAYNLLGTGAYGVKPYVVFSRFSGAWTPHINVGYQWNGFSVLRINPCYTEGTCTQNSTAIPTLRLPDSLDYSAGLDVGILRGRRKVSLVADLVGQRYFNAPRIVSPAKVPSCPINTNGASICLAANPQLGSVQPSTVAIGESSYSLDNFSIGIKFNPAGNLILSANALIRLDSGGLRPARVVPLAGISYRF